jgi:hypothetical protein
VRIVHLPEVTPSAHTLFGFAHADVRGKVRADVKAQTGLDLHWEIRRIGTP